MSLGSRCQTATAVTTATVCMRHLGRSLQSWALFLLYILLYLLLEGHCALWHCKMIFLFVHRCTRAALAGLLW